MKTGSMIGVLMGIVFIMIIIGVVVTLNQESDIAEVEDVIDKEIQPTDIPEIENKYDEILANEKILEDGEYKYENKDREWQTSGPFQIDRNEYAIGEKVFVRMGGLQIGEKGEIAVMRPLNDTHTRFYLSIPFDETKNPTFNQYFEPSISKSKGICSVDDLDGTWFLVFRGTEYEHIQFDVNKELGIVGGTDIEPAC